MKLLHNSQNSNMIMNQAFAFDRILPFDGGHEQGTFGNSRVERERVRQSAVKSRNSEAAKGVLRHGLSS